MSEATKKVLLSILIAAVTAAATKGLEELSKINVNELLKKKETAVDLSEEV